MKYTDDQLVSEWSTVKSTKKILEVRERELGQVIMEKIKKDSKNLAYDTGEVYIRQSSRTTYDIDTILKVIPVKELDKVVSINKNRIEKYMDNNPAVKATISETAITNYSSPFWH
jgi:phage-related baseplate assembly protein